MSVSSELFAIGLSLINILLVAYVLHKVRRVHLMGYRISDEIRRVSGKHLVDLHQQIQIQERLCRELELDDGLPPTRGWAASPDFLLLVSRHAREAGPMVVVECGSGTSTVVLARCMQLNGSGHVYSLDHDPEFAEETRANLLRYGLAEWATIIDASLRPHVLGDEKWNWYSEENLPDSTIDLLVVDGPPEPFGPLIRYPAGPILFPRLSAGGMVFLDDAAREDELRIVERWMEEFDGLQRREYDCEKGAISLRFPTAAP